MASATDCSDFAFHTYLMRIKEQKPGALQMVSAKGCDPERLKGRGNLFR